MAIFYTETGSIAKLQVSGSGTSIFSISGSGGPLLDVSDINAATTDIFTITSASIEVFNIDRNRNIDISGSVSIVSTIAGSIFDLNGPSSASVFYASSSGDIGIGTNNPRYQLHLQDSGSIQLLIEADADNVNEAHVAELLLTQDGATTTANFSIDQNNQVVIGSNSITSSGIILAVRNDGTTFATASDAKIYISASGNVGVSTTTPSGRLDVAFAGLLNNPTLLLGADDSGSTTRTNSIGKLTRVGVPHYNTSATAATIIIGSSTINENGVFIGGGSAYLNAANNIRFFTGTTTTSLTGTEAMRISGSGQIIMSASLSVSGTTNISHLDGNTSTPSVGAGTGAGTGPVGGIFGTDLAGSLRIKTGTTPAALAPIGTVTFTTPYETAPYIVFSPANTSSAALSQSFAIYVTSSGTSFTAFSNLTALPAATQFTWSYHVIQ
jgi:hypothetical protein